MKYLLIILSLFAFGPGFTGKGLKTEPGGLTCLLTTDKTKYKIGEVPSLKVSITNNTGKDIYLIGALDGSELKWRMPYCYFTVDKPVPDTIQDFRCGNINSLREKDFILVKHGEAFDPYQRIDHYGYFSNSAVSNPETFKYPGTYKISFSYSTNYDRIDDFLGHRSDVQKSKKKNPFASLISRVPQIELVSNEIEIYFEK